MRHLLALVALVALAFTAAAVSLGSPAWADSFGGFSADETAFLVGRDTICAPLTGTAPTGMPACERADASRVAAHTFRAGVRQKGPRARYEAEARGTTLTVRAIGGAGAGHGVLVTWTAIDPISAVTEVYASPNRRLLAVEYQSRFGGRARTEVVAFALGAAAEAGVAAPASQPAAPSARHEDEPTKPAPVAAPPPPATKEVRAALAQARKRGKRLGSARAGRTAEAAYRKVLALDAEHTEARFGLARALAVQGKHAQATAELEALGRSARGDAIEWLIEARFDRAFAKLRGNAAFRSAVGLDAKAGASRSLYERLVGFSNTWEQPELTCEQAQINLDLTRIARSFTLRITSRCGGYKDETRLAGRWTLAGDGRLVLTMPNKQGPDEKIACVMKVCPDSGEDCLHCGVDTDLGFVLKVVRR